MIVRRMTVRSVTPGSLKRDDYGCRYQEALASVLGRQTSKVLAPVTSKRNNALGRGRDFGRIKETQGKSSQDCEHFRVP